MNKILISILLFALASISISAQQIEDEKIKVVKSFRSQLFATQAITDRNIFILEDSNTRAPKNHDNPADSLVDLSAQVSTPIDIDVSPITHARTKPKQSPRNFLGLYKGTINNWSGQLDINHRVDNYFQVFVDGHYDQWAQQAVTDQYTNSYSGSIGAKYYISDKVFSKVSVGLGQDMWGRYGGNIDSEAAISDTARYDHMQFGIELRSFDEDRQAINYAINAQLKQTEAHQAQIENQWNFSPELYKNWGKSLSTHLESDAVLNTIDTISTTVANNRAYLYHNHPTWSFKLGASYNYDTSESSLFPYAQLNFNINKNNQISLHAQQTKTLQGIRQLAQENPYLTTSWWSNQQPIVQTTNQFAMLWSSNAIQKTEVELEAQYQTHQNALNYLLTENQKGFELEAVDYNQVSIQAHITHQINNTVSVQNNLQYNHYDSQETLYHRPMIQGELMAQTHWLEDKLQLSAGIQYTSPQQLYTQQNEIIESGYRQTINLALDYQWQDRVIVRLHADNILNDDFEALAAHRLFGRNLSAGVIVKF